MSSWVLEVTVLRLDFTHSTLDGMGAFSPPPPLPPMHLSHPSSCVQCVSRVRVGGGWGALEWARAVGTQEAACREWLVRAGRGSVPHMGMPSTPLSWFHPRTTNVQGACGCLVGPAPLLHTYLDPVTPRGH